MCGDAYGRRFRSGPGMINLRRRRGRYGFSLNFAAGFAGAVFVAVAVAQRFDANLSLIFGPALVVALLLHARLGFALSSVQEELEVMDRLLERAEPKRGAKPAARAARNPAAADPNAPLALAAPEGEAADFDALMRVREAIVAERIDLFLQPIVSLPQRKTRYYEAFSRLRDANGRVMRPAEYLEAAERTNRIAVIDDMILMRCIQALRRRRAADPRLTVFCNLSPASLFDEDFFNDLTDYLEANADLAASLVFEFTYPAIEMMHPKASENLEHIAERGFAFSVDHVHSLDLDWEALRSRGFRYAKAPAEMLLAASRGAGASAEKLSYFRKRLADVGVDLIAEKIERESQMPDILSIGLDFGQGNLFGPAREASHYLGQVAKPDKTAPRGRLALAS